jgi:predicted glycoside hydrolase/deacetylase ChbG (UPF0249 family)
MLIINADDWGRSCEETDAELACFSKGRITSVTAMMFMRDSQRAAEIAKGAGLDVGLHLNLNQSYTGAGCSPAATQAHERIVRFMARSKHAMFVYHPILKRCFREVFQSQLDEFHRLYGVAPSHVDGHQHRHLCANMLIDRVIPAGEKVRRNFSFWPGEKSLLNRTYRKFVDRWLARRYVMTDYFFSLGQCLRKKRLDRVAELARTANVELMTHPIDSEEYAWLTSDRFSEAMQGIRLEPYARLQSGQTAAQAA